MATDHFEVNVDHFEGDDFHCKVGGDHFEVDGDHFEVDGFHCKVGSDHFKVGGDHFEAARERWPLRNERFLL